MIVRSRHFRACFAALVALAVAVPCHVALAQPDHPRGPMGDRMGPGNRSAPPHRGPRGDMIPPWPFASEDEARRAGVDTDSAAPTGHKGVSLWLQAIQDFSIQREVLAELSGQQERLLEKLDAMRNAEQTGDLGPDSTDRAAKMRDLLEAAQENEKEVERIHQGLAKGAAKIVAHVSEVREGLLGLQTHLAASTSAEGKRGHGGRRMQDYRRRLADAIALLEKVEADPKRGAKLLLAEMPKFVPPPSSDREGDSPLIARLRDRIDRIDRSNRFLEWRLKANEREIKSVRKLIDKIAQRQETITELTDDDSPETKSDTPPPPPPQN
jgi:hypothetical protein